jgi:hypothetical protein
MAMAMAGGFKAFKRGNDLIKVKRKRVKKGE